MFSGLSLLGAIFGVKQIVKEATEKPVSADMVFDWDAYWKDVENGMSIQEQNKKRQRGGYYTYKPRK